MSLKRGGYLWNPRKGLHQVLWGICFCWLWDHTTGPSQNFSNSSRNADGFMRPWPSRTRIYHVLNELMKNDYRFVRNIADVLVFCFLNIRNTFLFSLKLSITHNDLIEYTFVNRKETFIFFSLPNHFRIPYWIYLFSLQYNFFHKFNKNLPSL